jgi:hypothetical protein
MAKSPGARAGQQEPGWEEYNDTFPKNSGDGGIAAGLFVDFNAGKARTVPTTGASTPIYGCLETALDTDLNVRVARKGPFYCWSQGAIVVGKKVQPSTVTAGHAQQHTGTNPIIGDYLGHPGEGDGKSPYTDSINGDLIMVDIDNQ